MNFLQLATLPAQQPAIFITIKKYKKKTAGGGNFGVCGRTKKNTLHAKE
jgi:hypothetical protein